MCRWLAYAGESRLIEQFVYDGPRSLCSQAQQSHKAKLGVHGDGGGLGWYGAAPEPGLYRRSGPAWADVNLRDLTHVVESRVFFAHVRASTGAPNIDINCHPFRAGSFLFMHNGQIGGFKQLRRQLTAMLTEECFDALQGGTDSELLFQLMITNGLCDDPESAIRRSILQVEKMRQEAGIAEAFRATFAITDSKHVWALRWSSDDYAPSLYLTQKHNGALIVSEPLDKDTLSWQKVPADTLVRIAIGANEVSVAQHEAFLAG
jgi:predicted glutamine amidotransferase